MASPGTATPADYEGRPIRALRFLPQQQPYPQEELVRIAGLKIGAPLRLAEVRQAIERLYATLRYADIEVDAALEDGGVSLSFLTRQHYFVSRVTVQGVSSPPGPGVLANATRLDLGALHTEEDTRQAIRGIQDVLRQNGFYGAQVTPQIEHDTATQQLRLHFLVESGKRARYARPAITGNPGRPDDEIIGLTNWKGWFGWKPVTEARTGDGVGRIRRYYNKRDRLEARVSLTKLDFEPDSDRVTPSLNVEAGPKTQIRLAGADLSRGKLRQLLPVYEEQSVDRDLLVEGARNLKQYFENQGYFDAEVEFSYKQADGAANTQVVEYQADLRERHKLTSVTIAGNRYFGLETLRERMSIRPASLLQFRHGRFSRAYLERDVEAIESLYRSSGFRDVSVKPRIDQAVGGKANRMALHLEITEGAQWLVEKLDLEGVAEQHREAVAGMLQSQPGQPFSEFNIGIDRDNVLNYYYNQGYSDALFEYSFEPGSQAGRMRLRYRITEGSQRFVRAVLIAGGLEATDEALVRERIVLEPGDVLSRAWILETQRRLYDLGIFARVDSAIQNPDGVEQNKYLLLDFEEARKWTITGGVGAEIAKIGGCSQCLESPAGEAGFSPRVSFGVTRRNFLGTGHIISLQTRVSTLQQRGVLSYNAPQFRGNPDVSLLFSALYDDSRDVRTFTARRREASAQIGQRLSRASTMLYRLAYRRVSVSDLKIYDPVLLPQYLQPVRLGIIAGNLIQDRRDDPTDAHRGIYNTLDFGYGIMPPTETFRQTNGFLRLVANNATYHPFGFGSRYVLARSISFGWMQRPATDREIPLPERFFGGGPNSHRGFPSNQAGPRDLETGFPLGGRAVLVHQVEMRYPIVGENIRGVAFLDSGNVYSSLSKLSLRVNQKGLDDFNYMVHAVGLGLRYKTPVGPVRLDLGYSINPPKFFGCKGTIEELQRGCPQKTVQQIGHFQFQFSLGQAF